MEGKSDAATDTGVPGEFREVRAEEPEGIVSRPDGAARGVVFLADGKMAFPDENGSYNNTLGRQIPRTKSRKPTATLADYEIRNLCRGSPGNEICIAIPFLLLFVVAYWYTGLMSPLQDRFERSLQRTTTHTKPFPVGV